MPACRFTRFALPILLIAAAPAVRAQQPNSSAAGIVDLWQMPGVELPDQLTLEEALRIALATNPSLDTARERIVQAAAAVRQVRSGRYPNVSATGTATYTFDLPQTQFGPLDETQKTYSLGAELQWLVWDADQTANRIAAAQAGEETTRQSFADSQRVLSQAVTSSFYNALLAQENMRVAQRDLEYNESLQKDEQRRLDAGTVGRTSVLNFEIRAAQAQSTLLSDTAEYDKARIALAELLGLRTAFLPDSVSLVDPRIEQLSAQQPQLPDINAEVAAAFAKRPDLRALESAEASALASLEEARGARLPTLSLAGGYGFERADTIYFSTDNDDQAYIRAQLSYDIFTAGRRDAEIEEAASALEEARADLANSRNSVVSELRRERRTLEEAWEQLRQQERIAKLAREIRDAVRKEYDTGNAAVTRLNEAQTDLVRAEANLASARINVRLAEEYLAMVAARKGFEQ